MQSVSLDKRNLLLLRPCEFHHGPAEINADNARLVRFKDLDAQIAGAARNVKHMRVLRQQRRQLPDDLATPSLVDIARQKMV
jgi:hypothetical protein